MVALLVAFTAAGQSPARPVQSLKLDPVPFDDVSELLHVLKRSGRLTLAEDAPNGRLAADFYTAGKKAELTHSSVGYGVAIRPEPRRDFRFAVQFADLDYLRLGDGPKGTPGCCSRSWSGAT
jgi:hypothetical protein